MATWLTSIRNQFRSPSGAPNEAPDGPGAFQQLRDDVENYIGVAGAEYAATPTARDAIPSGRVFTGKKVFVASENIVYRRTNATGWQPWESEWITYTPTFTNFTLGNGVLAARYKHVDGMLLLNVAVALGSTSAMTGALVVGLPLTIANTPQTIMAQGRMAGSVTVDATLSTSSTTSVRFAFRQVSGTNIVLADTSATAPFTWAAGNSWEFLALLRDY